MWREYLYIFYLNKYNNNNNNSITVEGRMQVCDPWSIKGEIWIERLQR